MNIQMDKALKKIQNNIAEFVKSIDEELSTSFNIGEGYYFETETNTVNVDLTDFEDCGFMRHLKEIHKCSFAYDYPLFIWSILHEIGHYETEWELLEDDDEAELRFWLSLTNEDCRNNIEIQNKYYNLTAEWEATEWAIQWIKENKDELKKLVI